MIKRTLAVIAVTGLALAVPAAAFAGTEYPAPEPTLTCDPPQTTPGGTVDCVITGEDGDEAQLQTTFSGADAGIAGTVTSDVKIIAGGEAAFTVTAPSIEGTIGISGILNGVAFDTADVVVAEELSATGFDSMPLAVGAGVLLVAGAAVVFVAARRRSAANN